MPGRRRGGRADERADGREGGGRGTVGKLVWPALGALAFSWNAAAAQAPAAPRPPVVSETPIDAATAARLVWWTITAVDQANYTGNYSVLRDIGVPAFQASNSAASLATTFQVFRTQNLDLGAVLNVVPTFQMQPAVKDEILRLRGVFPVRPMSYGFDLLYQSVNGRWALLAISITPLTQVQRGSTGK